MLQFQVPGILHISLPPYDISLLITDEVKMAKQ